MACYEWFKDVVVYTVRNVEDGEGAVDVGGRLAVEGTRRGRRGEGEIEVFVVV